MDEPKQRHTSPRRRAQPRRRAYTGDTIAQRTLPQERSHAPTQTTDHSQKAVATVDRQAWHAARRKRAARRKAKRQDTLQRIWFGTRVGLGVALVLVLLGGYLFYRQVGGIADAIVLRDMRSNPSIASPLLGGANVLIVGIDERPDHPEEGVRSDTLILARLNGAGQWVNLLAIPRDTQVDLRDVGITKINVAYGQGYARATEWYSIDATPAQGGMALAAETVEHFFTEHGRSMRVDYTAQVNFAGFVQVIDALGGITIDVPQYILDEAYPTPDYGFMQVEFQPGIQRMDGETALIYARTRHADSDYGRSQRQQQVMRAIVAELQNRSWMGRVAAVPGLLESIKGDGEHIPPVLTTLPIDRFDVLLGVLMLAGGLEQESIGQIQINPETVSVIEDGSNLIWESEGIRIQFDQLYRKPATLELPTDPATP